MKALQLSTVLISGASSGIGKEFARQLHSLGARVLLVARREEILAKLCLDFNKIRAESAYYLRADLSTVQDLKQVVAWIKEQNIDILINNAGRGSFGYFENLQIEEEIEMLRVNCEAALQLSSAVIPQMKKRGEGSIVYVSSVAAFAPLPYMASYSATKAFDLFHALALRAELSSFGVNVLAVCPGPTDTEFGGVARVPGRVTGIRRDKVEMVVERSIKAMQKGKAIVVPGLSATILTWAAQLLPFALRVKIVERLLQGSLQLK